MENRRVFLGSMAAMAGATLALKETGVSAAGPSDPVLETLLTEMMALQKRSIVDPGNAERLLEFASMFRVIDAVTTAHDLKKNMRKARAISVDSTVTEPVAKRLREHGIKTTGDDLLKRHFEARLQLQDPEGAERAVLAAVTSGQMFMQTAALFDDLATMAAVSVNGVTFRERLRGQEFDVSMKKTM